MNRRQVLRGLAAASMVVASRAVPAAPAGVRARLEDFDALWRAVDRGYAYFEGDRASWGEARRAWRPRAGAATDDAAFLIALQGALDALRDDAVRIVADSPALPRRIPEESGIWPRFVGAQAMVESVRASGAADVAGVAPGQEVLAVDGVNVARAVEALAGGDDEHQARDWALRRLLAGPREGVLRLRVREGNAVRELAVERGKERRRIVTPVARRIGEERDLGYLRLHGTPGGALLHAHLDRELEAIGATRALILDLRDWSGPESRAVSEAVLARFAPAGTPWQVRLSRDGARSIDRVSAVRGAFTYDGPLVVLVDRWTAGPAEALAAGLREAAHGRLIGTAMAGLRGAPGEIRLPHSGVRVRYPAQRTLLADGTPREALRPAIAVDPAHPSGGPGDPILYQALKALEAMPR